MSVASIFVGGGINKAKILIIQFRPNIIDTKNFGTHE